MKILIGSGTPEQLGRGVLASFQEKGWNAIHLDTSPISPYYKPFIKPVRKIINALRIQRAPSTFETWSISNINWRSNRWLNAIKEYQPDIVLHLWGHRISEPIMSEACKLAPHLCWMIEAKERLSTPLEYYKKGYYKNFIVYAKNYIKVLDSENLIGKFMPHFAPFRPTHSLKMYKDRKYDWVFLGSHSPWREKCLLEIITRFPKGFILGPRWKHALRRHKAFKKITVDGYLDGEESYQYYRDAIVGVDIPTKQEWIENGVTMRIPELLSCGSHILANDSAEIRLLPYFHEKSFTLYNNSDDLGEKMKLALQVASITADDDRMSIANSASGYDSLVELVGELAKR